MPENSFLKDGYLHIKATKLADNINPLTGEAFGEDYLDNGDMDLIDMFGYCSVPDNDGCARTGRNLPGQSIPPMASARLRTAGRFAFQYGHAEIRAKIAVGDWLWPALWLLPEEWRYGGWPESGEIDILEAIGNRDYVCDVGTEKEHYRDIRHAASTLHWGVDFNQNRYYLTSGGIDNEDLNYGDHFHTYELDWNPQGMWFYIDGVEILRVPDPAVMDRDTETCFQGFFDFGAPWNENSQTPWPESKTCTHLMAPFDQKYHFLFNVAVGGANGYIPDNCRNKQGDPVHEKPWENNFCCQEPVMFEFYDAQDAWYPTWTDEGENNNMQVDYIRVYQDTDYGNTVLPDGCPEPPEPVEGSCPE